MGKEVFYITTPLYYVNDVPHVGHAYSTVAADVLARFQRACGREVFFLTGTDEHGSKVEKAAKEKGYATPKALADEVHLRYQDLWKLLSISFDRFIRTTDEDHRRTAEKFWKAVAANGFIEKRSYTGWYCVHEETFWPENQLQEPGHLCPDCGRPTQETSEENYFFKQTAFAGAMRRHLAEHPDFVQPEARRNEILGSYLNLEGGVQDQSISRGSVKWGLPVPGDPDQVIYVWFDALINYITAAGWESDPKRFARMWPADVHIIGKDILRFHAVLWPAMLLAAGLELPRKVFGTGFIVNEGRKMSKSLGNVVDPVDWAKRFGPEVLRYYILREVPFGHDGSVSEDGIKGKFNTELANEIGNLLSRTLSMVEKYADGKIPAPGTGPDPLVDAAAALWGGYAAQMEALSFHEALDSILAVVRRANKYVDDCAPWKMAKDPGKRAALDACLYNLAETLRIVSCCLSPFMPGTAARMLQQLGLGAGAVGPQGALAAGSLADQCRFGGLEQGMAVAKGEPLFPRIEDAAV